MRREIHHPRNPTTIWYTGGLGRMVIKVKRQASRDRWFLYFVYKDEVGQHRHNAYVATAAR